MTKDQLKHFLNMGDPSGCHGCLCYVLAVLMMTALIFCSCRSIEYVPVETVRTDTLWQKIVERDSIIVNDSVIVREKGDTVMIEKWHTKYRDRLKTDTMYVSKTDSVQVPYPVEKKLTRWETFCIDYGKVMLGASVVLVAFIIIWLVRKIKKR